MNNRTAGNKYILGWFKLHPDKQDEFGALARDYSRRCREEEGCLFFELVPHHDDIDTFLLAEAFVSEEAHAWHLEQPYFGSFVEKASKLCRSGHFENVIAASVECNDPIFE
jgi:quinol monooxygenase YgiN